MGWELVFESVEVALRRFYHKCAQFAVVGVDNDGNHDLDGEGISEDPVRKRHWLHPGEVDEANCRYCALLTQTNAVRPHLHWLPKKPGHLWPIILAIPAEAIEAWLLVTKAILNPGEGSLRAEREQRHTLKQRFYGRPVATRRDVEDIALPMIRSMTMEHLEVLKDHAESFRQLSEQVTIYQGRIMGDTACW